MIVIVRNFGQLGNRLFLSAHLIAAAREYGVTLVNPSFAEYAKYFPATASDLWCRYPQSNSSAPPRIVRRVTYKTIYLAGKAIWLAGRLGVPVPMIRLVGEEGCDLESESFRVRASSSMPLLVSGWKFRSSNLLRKHREAVRAHFEILPSHRQNVTELIRRVREGADFVVGVHVRQGDYATFENGKYFYSTAQYVDAMRRVKEQLSGRTVSFLVCGNTQFDRRDFGDLNVHFGTGHLVEDMYAFAETDLLVGPPSTYTGWASFYGDVPLQLMETADQQFDVELPASAASSSSLAA